MRGIAPWVFVSAVAALLVACSAGPSPSGDATSDTRGDGAATSDATDASMDRASFDGTSFDIQPIDVTAADSPPPGDGGVDCGTPVTDVPYAAHTANEEFTDPPTCSGCPSPFAGLAALNTSISPDATTIALDGTSAGATRCEWYVLGGSCGVTHGTLVTDPDGGGMFAATVPVFCGTNIVQVVCENSAGRRVYVRRVEGTQCPTTGRDLRVTLAWDNLGTDMELHLVRAGGHINREPDDCTWFTCVSRQPMWGVDAMHNPRKDVDNVSYYGPENIFLDQAPDGTYNVLVEFWGGGSPSTNEVDITIRERTVAHLTRPMLAQHWVWYVGDVTFPAGTFTPRDSLTDCTASWRLTTMGCDLLLP